MTQSRSREVTWTCSIHKKDVAGPCPDCVKKMKADCPPHSWKETGRRDWIVPIRNGKPMQHRVLWTWLKCPLCGQDGFRRDASPVVYTWRPEHMEVVY